MGTGKAQRATLKPKGGTHDRGTSKLFTFLSRDICAGLRNTTQIVHADVRIRAKVVWDEKCAGRSFLPFHPFHFLAWQLRDSIETSKLLHEEYTLGHLSSRDPYNRFKKFDRLLLFGSDINPEQLFQCVDRLP